MRGKTILVTGGAGFIGSHLTERLLSSGNKVIVLDSFSTGSLDNLGNADKAQLTVIHGDIRRINSLRKLMRDVDIVFHLAVQCLVLSLKRPRFVHEVNATGTLNLCITSMEMGIEKLIYISSSEVYGTSIYVPMDENHPLNPTTPYGASKAAGEMYVRSFHNLYDLPSVIVRPFNAYGPRHRMDDYSSVVTKFIERVSENQPPIIFGDGKQTRDFSYVSDIVEGILLAAESPELIGDVVNIGYGQEVSIEDLAQNVLQIFDKENELEPIYKESRGGDVHRHLADISKARRLLEFEPKIPIEKGLRMYVNWWRRERKA